MRAKPLVTDAEFEIVQNGRPLRKRRWYVSLLIGVGKVFGKCAIITLAAVPVAFLAVFGFHASDRTLHLLLGPTMIAGIALATAAQDRLQDLWARYQVIRDRRRSSRAQLRE